MLISIAQLAGGFILLVWGADRLVAGASALARNLGRAGEEISVIALDELTPEKVDMLTVVLVGSTATRRVARGDGGCWVYTPRGYAAKTGKSAEDAA